MPCTGSTSTCGILRAALAKLLCTTAPSMISTLFSDALSNSARRVAVLASARSALSQTMMPPSRSLADSACLSASARTFLGRSCACERTTGPIARPPPRNCGTRAEPWRAPPVPFCLYIFLPVRWISARPRVLCVPAWRLASCQRSMRAIRSWRGSSPKIASFSSREPAAAPLIDVTSIFMMSGSLRLGCGGFWPASLVRTEFAGQRRFLRQRLFPRGADPGPAAGMARHRPFDQDQPAFDIGLHDAQVLRRHLVDAHMAGHFLVLPGLAGVLTAASRTVRAMRNRHAMRGAQAAEVPALHRASEALADRHAGHVDKLSDQEMIGGDLGADRDEPVLADAELGELHLRLDIGDSEARALGLRHVLDLGAADAELEGGIAVLVLGSMGHALAALNLEDGDRHVIARIGEDAGHTQLLCNNA